MLIKVKNLDIIINYTKRIKLQQLNDSHPNKNSAALQLQFENSLCLKKQKQTHLAQKINADYQQLFKSPHRYHCERAIHVVHLKTRKYLH